MRDPFVLLDPGLLVPPAAAAPPSEHHSYWLRLIEWSADKRLRLGRRGQHTVLEILGTDWPNPAPPRCPHGLKREASQALNVLLASVVTIPPDHQASGLVDTTDPAYVKDPRITATILTDIAEQHDLGLAGTATTDLHWSEPAPTAKLSPGPPMELPLITTPGSVSAIERNFRVAKRMGSRRLTIVGGMAKETVYKELEKHFGVAATDIRWLETEKSCGPPLDRLKGMQPDADIVFCITSWIGHAESEKVVKLSRRCGVVCVRVERRSEIVERLREHLGD